MIKELEKSFVGRGEVRGFKFTQMNVTDRGFIYEVDNDGDKHYEVFKKKVNTQYSNISYPSSKAFGTWAWSCATYNKALSRLENFKSPA